MALGKRVRTVFCIFLSSILLLALFPFYIVFADTNTYIVATDGKFMDNSGQSDMFVKFSSGHSEIRGLMFTNQYPVSLNTHVYFYWVSQNDFYFDKREGGMPTSTNTHAVYDSDTGYYFAFAEEWNFVYTDYPIIQWDNSWGSYTQVYGATKQKAIYFTFGEGSVTPEPEINYGDLIIEGYSTDIAGQGEASINNIDHIKWNGYVDSNGNDISNCKVRLQIVPGKYTGTSKNDLTNKTRQDFVIDPINASDSLFDATVGEVSLSWRDIVNRIDIIPYRLYSLELFGPDWQKDGWIYKLRLEDENNEYIGEWQTVYSSTSNGVQNDLNITNITTINQTLIQSFQELNSINNVENNWTYNNTEISVENNYSEPSSGEKPWWAYLLESILNTFNITNNYIYEGDTNTQNITNTVNDSDDDMNNKIGEYQQFEDSFINDMDDNLTDIDTDIDFLSDNKFIASANWVAQQYNRMTNNTVIGSFIGFSLLFGLALIFIGKIH